MREIAGTIYAKGYRKIYMPQHWRADKDGYVLEHIIVVENALGKKFPKTHPIHHVNEDRADNSNVNLVLCQDTAYHRLLHVRVRVVRAGGNPDLDKICWACSIRPKTQFTVNRTTADGLEQLCIDCSRQRKCGTERFRRGRKLIRYGFLKTKNTIDIAILDDMRSYCDAFGDVGESSILPSGEAKTLPVSPENRTHLNLIKCGSSILQMYGYTDIRYLSGAIIPKYPGEGRRAFHTDWWNWYAPEARRAVPPAVGVLIYLHPTRHAGELVVIPESHRTQVKNHIGCLGSFSARADEVKITCVPGDAVLLDSRIIHAVTENRIDKTRICVTLWYLLDWSDLSEETKATVQLSMDVKWKTVLGNLYPEYTGTAKPVQHVKIPVF